MQGNDIERSTSKLQPLWKGKKHARQRKIRHPRDQPPGPGLQRHEENRGLLHRGTWHATDQNHQSAVRFRAAFLFRRRQRRHACLLLVSGRARERARRDPCRQPDRRGLPHFRPCLDESPRLQRPRAEDRRLPEAAGSGRGEGNASHQPRRFRNSGQPDPHGKHICTLHLLQGSGRHTAGVRRLDPATGRA